MDRSAECVTPKHPDKICDRISDAILDACLEQDPYSRVAIETFGCHGVINVGGELTTKAFVDVNRLVKRIVGETYGVQVNIVQQSAAIAQGVDTGGAGDQGIMTGYACDDNEDGIPQELYLARSLCKFIYNLHPYDGKTQVVINSDLVLKDIVASFQNTTKEQLEQLIQDWLKINLFPRVENLRIHVNAAGDWTLGGFDADTGLTGRKLMVDNYGPRVAIGGGCFSGKDATKVDRSGAYMARKIAVRYKEQLGAKEVFVKIAYCIGIPEPVMVSVIADGIEVPEEEVLKIWDLTPKGIIDYLDLRKPQFEKTAEWGHFGNNFPWDRAHV